MLMLLMLLMLLLAVVMLPQLLLHEPLPPLLLSTRNNMSVMPSELRPFDGFRTGSALSLLWTCTAV